MAFRCFPSMDEREEDFERYTFEGDPLTFYTSRHDEFSFALLGDLVETEEESIEFLIDAMEQSSAVAELCRNVDGTDYVVVVTLPELGDQKIFTYLKKAADQTFEAFSYAPGYQGEECYAEVLATWLGLSVSLVRFRCHWVRQ